MQSKDDFGCYFTDKNGNVVEVDDVDDTAIPNTPNLQNVSRSINSITLPANFKSQHPELADKLDEMFKQLTQIETTLETINKNIKVTAERLDRLDKLDN